MSFICMCMGRTCSCSVVLIHVRVYARVCVHVCAVYALHVRIHVAYMCCGLHACAHIDGTGFHCLELLELLLLHPQPHRTHITQACTSHLPSTLVSLLNTLCAHTDIHTPSHVSPRSASTSSRRRHDVDVDVDDVEITPITSQPSRITELTDLCVHLLRELCDTSITACEDLVASHSLIHLFRMLVATPCTHINTHIRTHLIHILTSVARTAMPVSKAVLRYIHEQHCIDVLVTAVHAFHMNAPQQLPASDPTPSTSTSKPVHAPTATLTESEQLSAQVHMISTCIFASPSMPHITISRSECSITTPTSAYMSVLIQG